MIIVQSTSTVIAALMGIYIYNQERIKQIICFMRS